MYDSRKYRPTDPALADEFLAAQRHATLMACAPGAAPQASILPYLFTDPDTVELHCVQADATFAAVRANAAVSLLVSDYLAATPHHWVDPVDGSQSTLHFEAVLLHGTATVTTEPAEVAAALARLVEHVGHGPDYAPVVDDERYGPQLRRLAVVRIHVLERQVKFKVGSGDIDRRTHLAEQLRARDEPGDRRAADEFERLAPRLAP